MLGCFLWSCVSHPRADDDEKWDSKISRSGCNTGAHEAPRNHLPDTHNPCTAAAHPHLDSSHNTDLFQPRALLTASASAPQPHQTLASTKYGPPKLDTVSTPQPLSSSCGTQSHKGKTILRERYMICNSSSVCSEPQVLQRADLNMDSCCTLPDGSLGLNSCANAAFGHAMNSPGVSSSAYSGRCLPATTAGSSWTSSNLSDSIAWGQIVPKARMLSRYAPDNWDTEHLVIPAPSRRQSGRSSCPSISPTNSLNTIPLHHEHPPQLDVDPTTSSVPSPYHHSSAPHLVSKPVSNSPCPPNKQARRASSLIHQKAPINPLLDLVKRSGASGHHRSPFQRRTKDSSVSHSQPLAFTAASAVPSAPLSSIMFVPTSDQDPDEETTGLTISIGFGEERPSVSALATSGTFSAENWVELDIDYASPASHPLSACQTSTSEIFVSSDAEFLPQAPVETPRLYNKPSEITRALHLQHHMQGQQHEQISQPDEPHSTSPAGPEGSVVDPGFCFPPSELESSGCSSRKCCQGIGTLEATAAFGSLSRLENSSFLLKREASLSRVEGMADSNAHNHAARDLCAELADGGVLSTAALARAGSGHFTRELAQSFTGRAQGPNTRLGRPAPSIFTDCSVPPVQSDMDAYSDELPTSPFSGSELDLAEVSGLLIRHGRITLAGGRKSPFSRKHLSIQVTSPANSVPTDPLMICYSSITQHGNSGSDDLGRRKDTAKSTGQTSGLLQLPLMDPNNNALVGARLFNPSVQSSISGRVTDETGRSSSISQALANIFSIGSRERTDGTCTPACSTDADCATTSSSPDDVLYPAAATKTRKAPGRSKSLTKLVSAVFERTAAKPHQDTQPAAGRLTIWGSLTGVGWFGRAAPCSSSASIPSPSLTPTTSVNPAIAARRREQNIAPKSLPFPLVPRADICDEVEAPLRASLAPPPSPQLTVSRVVLGYDPGSASPLESKATVSSHPLPRLLHSYKSPPSSSFTLSVQRTVNASTVPSHDGLTQHRGPGCQVSAATGSVQVHGSETGSLIPDPEIYALLQPPPVTVPAAEASAAVDASSLLAALSSFMGSGTMSDMWSESDDEQDGEGADGLGGVETARKSFENPVGAFMIDQVKPARLSSSSLSRPFFPASRSARALSLPSSSLLSAPLVPFPHHRLRSSMPNRIAPRLQQVVESDEVEIISSASTSTRVSSVRSRPWDCQSQ